MNRFILMALLAGTSFACASQPGVHAAKTAGTEVSSLDTRAADGAPRQSELHPAVPVHQPAPSYPLGERERSGQGAVLVHYTVLENGHVTNVETTDPSAFGLAAVHAVEQWQFEPASRDGHPVVTRGTARFTFRLESSSL